MHALGSLELHNQDDQNMVNFVGKFYFPLVSQYHGEADLYEDHIFQLFHHPTLVPTVELHVQK